ncbi:MAG: AMP-binding protein [Frankiaceae bacterium]
MSEATKAHQAYRDAGWWRDATFVDDLRRHATERPGKTAVIGHDPATGRTTAVSYAELSRATERMAHGLLDLGVRRGECIAVLLPDDWEMLPLTLACIRAGVRIAPIPPAYGRAQLANALRSTGARLLVTAPEVDGTPHAELALALSRDIGLPEQVVVLGDDRPPGTLSFAERFMADRDGGDDDDRPGAELTGPGLGPDEPFLLLFTSGTTGTTKMPVHSQSTLHAEIRGYAEALGFDGTLVNMTAHSNMYRAGLVTRLLCALVLGGTSVCMDSWDPAACVRLIARHGVTTFYGSPAFVRELLAAARDHPLEGSSLASVVSGSAPVPPQLIDEVRQTLGVRMFALWGMSENGAVTCTRWDDPEDWPAHSDGRPTGGMEVRIDPLPGLDDGTGALWVRGPTQCLGYHGQDDVYAAELDDDGWFSTGDLARDDGRGGIRLTGRAKDIIIHRCSNVPVAEVEAVLDEHPRVGAVALIGIPDPAVDERVCAVVTAAGERPPTIEELREHLRDAGISDWCWPEQLEVVDAMPRTPMGKVRKVELRARYAAEATGSGSGAGAGRVGV